MKKLPCSYKNCGDRRRHWCDPDTPRGQQMVSVEDDYTGPVYCSITCAVMAGAITLKPEDKNEL